MRSAVILSGKLGTCRSYLRTTLSGFDCDGGSDVGPPDTPPEP